MKLRNKLILSCAALAAVATTAVSTTFAWYTQNTEVKATGVSGKTYESDSSVLMISKDDYNWGSKVSLEINPQSMVPVENNNGTFKVWDQATNAVGGAAVANQDYITFDLYFKSGTTDSLNVFIKEFNLKNTTGITESQTTAVLPAKIKLNNTGLPVAATTYTVDMFRALTIDQISGNTKELTSAPAADNKPVAPATTSTKVWDAQSLKSSDSLAGANSDIEFDAHKYYNAVKGLETNTTADTTDDPIAIDKTNSETTREDLKNTAASGYDYTSWQLGVTGKGSATSAASDVLKVTFVIYLDGWDKACFDACQGQTFTLDMVFASSKVATQSGSGDSGSGNDSGNGGN